MPRTQNRNDEFLGYWGIIDEFYVREIFRKWFIEQQLGFMTSNKVACFASKPHKRDLAGQEMIPVGRF